jgi:arylformamidase
MKVTDLSHRIYPTMPVFPGTEPPRLEKANTLEHDGFAELKLSMYTHTGTHMDAPAHMLPGAPTLDQFPVEKYAGQAAIVDVRGRPGGRIERQELEAQADRLEKVEFVLFKTGWSSLWGQPEYFEAFPSLTPEAAEWLVGLDLKGVGIDAISMDAIESTEFLIHKILLGRNLVLIENLTNLEAVHSPIFLLSALPLKIEQADGSPVRAAALEDL